MRISVFGSMFALWVCATIGGAAQSDEIVQVLSRDAIPAIDRPTFEPAAEARRLDSNELMIGIVGTSEQRAYSTWQLDRHEIVNDVFEGKPIAVTW